MNDNKNNSEQDKISNKEVVWEIIKLGFPFILIILIYFFFIA